MTDSRPLILITNDDGIEAPGLFHLIDCVAVLGDIVVVAPARPQSSQSSAFTVNAPLRVRDHAGYHGATMHSVDGTPVDCVKLSMHHILPRRPDLILSGINHGSNAGNSLIYSGTMGAALEGCMQGIASVGFSLLHHSLKADFSECTPYVTDMARRVLDHGLPHDVCLNINFPAKVHIEGMKVVRAARSHWTEEYQTYTDPHGKPFYWLTGSLVNEEPEMADTDLYWLDRHYASVVPCTPDQNLPGTMSAMRSLFNTSE